MYMKASKLNVDDDVIGWAYEYIYSIRDRIASKDDILPYFIQRMRNAFFLYNSGYKHNYKEIRMSDQKLEYFNSTIAEENEISQKSIIDDFEKTLKNHEKLLLNVVMTGHDSALKISRFTAISRTSCDNMLRDLRMKFKNYVENKGQC